MDGVPTNSRNAHRLGQPRPPRHPEQAAGAAGAPPPLSAPSLSMHMHMSIPTTSVAAVVKQLPQTGTTVANLKAVMASKSSSTKPSATKRHQVPNACAACRRRKSKCDAVRPTCGACELRQTTCEYFSEPGETNVGSLKRKYNQLLQQRSAVDEVYALLGKCDESQVQSVVRHIRQGVEPNAILRQIKEGDVLSQVSLVPQTNLRYDFPFLKDMPVELLQPDNPYLNSLLCDSTLQRNSPLDQAAKFPTISRLTKPQSPYLKPYHAATLVEPLLDNVQPSKWTSVSKDDAFLRKLLSAYFFMEYQWLPIFQKDIFLEDMISGGTEFCSKLLVNALLARACQSSKEIQGRAEFWNPESLYYRFLAEARRYWELESATGDIRLTTLHAAVLLDMSYRVNCLDKIGQSYLLQAIGFAESMQLFKPSSPGLGRRTRIAREFTARTLYSYQTVQAYYYLKAPFAESQLEVPLPDPAQDKSWYGETWMIYPLDRFPVPTNFGHLHKAKFEFHLILTNLARRVFGRADHIAKLSVSEAKGYQALLESWYNGLHESLTPANIVFPAQLKLHMEYFKTVWLLWETLVDLNTAETLAQAIDVQKRNLEPSKVRFETLMRLYFLRHSFSSSDQYLVVLLLALACSALDRLESNNTPLQQDALISTVLLSAKGLFDQSQLCYVAEVVLHVVRDKMSPRVRALLAPYLRSQEEFDSRRGMASEITRSELPIPMVDIGRDPKLEKLENLVKGYSELSIKGAVS